MINIRSILKLKNNDGLTLKNGTPITYENASDFFNSAPLQRLQHDLERMFGKNGS